MEKMGMVGTLFPQMAVGVGDPKGSCWECWRLPKGAIVGSGDYQ